MVYFGEYQKDYCESGSLSLPSKWLEKETKCLYCAMVRDEVEKVTFLRFYDNEENLKDHGAILDLDEYLEILQSTQHEIIPGNDVIILPKEFCERSSGYQDKNWVCVGILQGFEVWYAEDYYRLMDGHDDELLDLFDDISL